MLFLVCTIVPSVLQLSSLPFCPESPKHLKMKRDKKGKKGYDLCYKNPIKILYIRSMTDLELMNLRETNDVDEEFYSIEIEAEKLKTGTLVGAFIQYIFKI